MLGNHLLQAGEKVEALRAASYGAGAQNGPWIDVAKYEGDLAFLYNAGAITGNIVYKLQDADDTGGTNAADLSPAVATGSITTAGTTGALIVAANAVRKAVRLVGTVTTGPVLAAGVLIAHPKYSA